MSMKNFTKADMPNSKATQDSKPAREEKSAKKAPEPVVEPKVEEVVETQPVETVEEPVEKAAPVKKTTSKK
jgi:hypothetical protein